MINYSMNIEIDDVDVLEQIINRKKEPGKGILRNYIDFIKEDYGVYKSNTANLESIDPDYRIEQEASLLLQNTYESNPKPLQKIKYMIKERLPDIVSAKCPYCMISAHSTFDHYLDKAHYPEYSVLSLNLIPSCSECNSLKGSSFLNERGERMFINFVYDVLPDYPFLKYKIGFKEGRPYLQDIYLEFEVESPINKVIEKHFHKLNLYERLKVQFENSVSTIMEQFKEYGFERSMVEVLLEKNIRSMERTKGINNWEVCLMRGLLENNDFLEDISI